jgi:hypothetical protein
MSNTKPTGTNASAPASVSLVKDENKSAAAANAAESSPSKASTPGSATPSASAAVKQESPAKGAATATKTAPKAKAPVKKTAAESTPKTAAAKPKKTAQKSAKKVATKKAATKKPAAPKGAAPKKATRTARTARASSQPIRPNVTTATANATLANFTENFADNGEFVKICSDYSNATVDAAKAMSLEYLQYVNDSFVENMELSKDLFHCRTVDDAIALHDRAVRSYMDNFFNQTTRLSEMFLEYTASATEPLNESLEATSKKLEKAFSA